MKEEKLINIESSIKEILSFFPLPIMQIILAYTDISGKGLLAAYLLDPKQKPYRIFQKLLEIGKKPASPINLSLIQNILIILEAIMEGKTFLPSSLSSQLSEFKKNIYFNATEALAEMIVKESKPDDEEPLSLQKIISSLNLQEDPIHSNDPNNSILTSIKEIKAQLVTIFQPIMYLAGYHHKAFISPQRDAAMKKILSQRLFRILSTDVSDTNYSIKSLIETLELPQLMSAVFNKVTSLTEADQHLLIAPLFFLTISYWNNFEPFLYFFKPNEYFSLVAALQEETDWFRQRTIARLEQYISKFGLLASATTRRTVEELKTEIKEIKPDSIPAKSKPFIFISSLSNSFIRYNIQDNKEFVNTIREITSDMKESGMTTSFWKVIPQIIPDEPFAGEFETYQQSCAFK